MELRTQIHVNAPEAVSNAFEVTVNICNAVNLNSEQFDLTFDLDVVNVLDVDAGNINGTTVPIAIWSPSGFIRILSP
ncbi:MAG: hypothetical protein EF813_00235 [Methanosarcinales archaeon]|nr:MAG: hypothetical protein EF813_00235 [Methanosarcinales archaeon]